MKLLRSGRYEIPILDFSEVSSWFFTIKVENLYKKLNGPVLIKLKGRSQNKVVVSCLLHGNEQTGFLALQNFLKPYFDKGQLLSKDILILIGNVEAASMGVRHLPHQPDFNRIWDPEHFNEATSWVTQVFKEIDASSTFAIVDIHNNTGLNPHYGCISSLKSQDLHLAALFGRTTVYFTRPKGAFSLVQASKYPSITLECGLSGVQKGVDHACEYLDAVFKLDHFPQVAVREQDLDLLEIFATIRVCAQTSFCFDEPSDCPLVFRNDLDTLNFSLLRKGERLASYRGGKKAPLTLVDNNGNSLDPRQYFEVKDGSLFTSKMLVPAMLTKDKSVISTDCLGYLMRKKSFS